MSTEKRIGGVKPAVFWSLMAGAAVLIVVAVVIEAASTGKTETAKAQKQVYDVPAIWIKACEKEAASYGTGALSTKAKRQRVCEKYSEMFPIVGLKGNKSRKKSDVEWAKNAGLDGGLCLAVKLTPETVRLNEGEEDYAFYADSCDTDFAAARDVFPKKYRALFGS